MRGKTSKCGKKCIYVLKSIWLPMNSLSRHANYQTHISLYFSRISMIGFLDNEGSTKVTCIYLCFQKQPVPMFSKARDGFTRGTGRSPIRGWCVTALLLTQAIRLESLERITVRMEIIQYLHQRIAWRLLGPIFSFLFNCGKDWNCWH